MRKVASTKFIDLNSIRNENTDESFSFLGMLQVYSDKTVTNLKAAATVAYAAHIVLLNFIKDFQMFLINRGHTIVEKLPVSVSQSAEETTDDDTALDYD